MNQPTKLSSLEAQMEEEIAKPEQRPVGPSVPHRRLSDAEVMDLIRNQPGRQPREVIIRMSMQQKGLTRAQAKAELKAFDKMMFERYREEELKVSSGMDFNNKKVKPLVANLFRGLGMNV